MSGGYTALYIACQQGDLEVVSFLIDNGADMEKPKVSACSGRSVSHFRLTNVPTHTLKVFFSLNSLPNHTHKDNGARPLYVSAANGHIEVCRWAWSRVVAGYGCKGV